MIKHISTWTRSIQASVIVEPKELGDFKWICNHHGGTWILALQMVGWRVQVI